jgi:hypothetical protein
MQVLVRQDRANHFLYGALVFTASFMFVNAMIALAITMLVGIGKEIYDEYSLTGTPDKFDALFTIVGGFVCYCNAVSWKLF